MANPKIDPKSVAAAEERPRPALVVAASTTTDEPKPKSDQYRVKGGGSIVANGGRTYVTGETVTLSESDALSVIDSIEPA